MPSAYSGPKLPLELRNQVGYQPRKPKGRNGLPHARVSRKDQRKLSRQQQKVRPQITQPYRPRLQARDDHDTSEDTQEDDETPPPKSASKESTRSEPKSNSEAPLKSAMKNPKHKLEHSPKKAQIEAPPTKRNKKLQDDDAEIAALEKRLGIKSKKLPKSFEEDGLESILGDLDGENANDKKRKRNEDREWLEKKRKRNDPEEEISSGDEDELTLDDGEVSNDHGAYDMDDSFSDTLDGLVGGDLSDDASELDAEQEETASDNDSGLEEGLGSDEENSFDISDDEPAEKQPQRTARENPYVAPGTDPVKPATKYIPPSLRGAPSSDAEANARLRRQTQGLLNRLSDANIISILGEVEKLYQSNPRQYVTSILIDLLIGLVCDPSPLNDTFMITHAGLVSAVYKVIGSDFGAQIIERLIQSFDEQYSTAAPQSIEGDNDNAASKKCKNLASLLAQLYNFQLVSSNLLFDYVRLFLDSLTELNTELLWIFMRLSGTQLRTDDPSSLKDIVLLLQRTVSKKEQKFLSVRTSFIIENITDLKNNRLKTGAPGRAITAEHTQQMRKTLGTLSNRPNLKATEPLRISLADVKDTEKKGKWWLVGASWKGNSEPTSTKSATITSATSNTNIHEDASSAQDPTQDNTATSTSNDVSLEHLAKASGMNTTIRRAIFITLLSASDPVDAHHRLLRLSLKRAQEPEIPRVLLHCAGAEARYNPYYTAIAKRVCAASSAKSSATSPALRVDGDGESTGGAGHVKMQKAFQFALWDLFGRMGEGREADDSSGDEAAEDAANGKGSLGMAAVVNHAKMFAALVAGGALPVTVLKKLDLVYLRPKTRVFVEVLLVTIITKGCKGGLAGVFGRARDVDELATGLQWFLKKVVAKTDLTKGEKERKTVQKACKELVNLLAGSEAGST